MSLGHGRHYLAIPGPSVTPDRVLQAMHRPSPNIYHGHLIDMVPGIVRDLKSLAGTSGQAAIYIANGHGAWEAALSNTLSRGHDVLVLVTGRFALGWSEIASSLGAKVQLLDFGRRSAVDATEVEKALRADTEARIKAVLMVHVDTSTSVRNDVAKVRKAMDSAGHDALLMVDCIASFGCDMFDMDDFGADVMLAASQKGLMTPPGVGFVFFNDRADKARETANCVTHYWDWRPRTKPQWFSQYFDGTAPTHHLYGLREALDMIAEEGRDAVWARHAVLANAIWAAVDHWGSDGPLALNVAEQSERSHAVTTICAGTGNGTALRNWVEANTGLTLGIGLDMDPFDDYFRIGHMGHVNAHMVLGALGVIEAGMKALGIEHRAGGVSAAAELIAAKV